MTYNEIVLKQQAAVNLLRESITELWVQFRALPEPTDTFDPDDQKGTLEDLTAFGVGFELPESTARQIALAQFDSIQGFTETF